MKNFLAITIFSLILSANSRAGVVQVVAQCSPEKPQPDQGFEVEVIKSFASRVGVPANQQTKITATVSEETIAGVRPVEAYVVAYKPADSRRPGSSASYQGKDFVLQFHTDGMPRPDGRVYGTLDAKTKEGRSVNEDLLCVLH